MAKPAMGVNSLLKTSHIMERLDGGAPLCDIQHSVDTNQMADHD